ASELQCLSLHRAALHTDSAADTFLLDNIRSFLKDMKEFRHPHPPVIFLRCPVHIKAWISKSSDRFLHGDLSIGEQYTDLIRLPDSQSHLLPLVIGGNQS